MKLRAVVLLLVLLLPLPAEASKRFTVIVLPFVGKGEGELGAVLAEALRFGLKKVRALSMVEPGPIEQALEQEGLKEEDLFNQKAWLRLGRVLKADLIVGGTFLREGKGLRLEIRLFDFRTGGEPFPLEPIEGPFEPFPLLGKVAEALVKHLKLPLSPSEERRLIQAFREPTPSLQAYALYEKGRRSSTLRTREGYEGAVELYQRALELDENFTLARYELGLAFLGVGNRWRAAGEFRKALQLDPEFAEAHVGMGDARASLGQYDEAIAEYQKALKIDPDNPRVHYGLGRIYYNEKGLYHEAVAEYQKAVGLDPGFIDAHLALGELYEEKGLYQEAVARYRQAVELEPNHPGAHYGLALALEKIDKGQAIQAWERYIQLASELQSEKDWVDIAKKHLKKLKEETRH